MKNIIIILVCAVSLPLLKGCAGFSIKGGTAGGKEKVEAVITEDIRRMISAIERVNKKSPSTFTSSIEVIGSIKAKKFKSIGSVSYNRGSKKFNITFLDYIFKSPVTRIFQDRDDIRIYFPADKKLIMDKSSTIVINNYMDLNIDYYLIYDLFCGSIPVIKNYTVRQGLSSADGKKSFLILENSSYFETVSFAGDEPDKFLIMRKDNREKIEIYLGGYTKGGGSRYFKNVRIVAKNSDLKLDFKFRKTRINIPVKVNTIDSIKLPRGVKIIKL